MEAQSYNGPNSLSVWCLGPPQPPKPRPRTVAQMDPVKPSDWDSIKLPDWWSCKDFTAGELSQAFVPSQREKKRMWWRNFTVTSGSYAMRLDGQWVPLCADKLWTVCVLARLLFTPTKWNHRRHRQMSWAPIKTSGGSNHPKSVPIAVKPHPPKQLALFLSRNKNTKNSFEFLKLVINNSV